MCDTLIVKDASFYKLCSILNPTLENSADSPAAKAKNTMETAIESYNPGKPDVVPPVPESNRATITLSGAPTGSPVTGK